MAAMGALMIENAFCDELIDRLAERYEEDPSEFVHLPQPTVASSLARLTVSELRNEGYVEEEVRGVIRLTARGYKVYKRRNSGSLAPKSWI
jgi:Mn-dependent DtxR family transcriptional regulator